jgi:hypothetical protein
MTRLDALIELRDKVKAGTADDFGSIKPRWPIFRGYAESAFHGSLDAAKALHKAVLPGWHYFFYGADYETCLGGNQHQPFCVVAKGTGGVDLETHRGDADTPARAWLLAILEALIAQETP